MNSSPMPMLGVITIMAACTAIAFCQAASAQSRPADPDANAWRLTAGAGVLNQPKYPGSEDRETQLVPVLSAGYGRWFIGAVPAAGVPLGIGANLVQTNRWRLGVAVGGNINKPREEDDLPRLRGLGDIERTSFGSVFGSFTEQWFSARVGVLTDLRGKGQGTRVAFDLEGRYSPFADLTLSAGPGLTWANRSYTQTFFGIDSTQSAASGRPAYGAESGINSVRLTVGADYRLGTHWGVGARITASRLRGDAEDSPITEDRSQNTAGLFLSYRF